MKEVVQNEPKSGGVLYRAWLRSSIVAKRGEDSF